MTGREHFRRAEELLSQSGGEELEFAAVLVAQAQVQAKRALAVASDRNGEFG